MKQPATILVVDDNTGGELLGTGIPRMLRDEGYRVEVASDGADGLDRVHGGDVAVIVCDMDLLRRATAILRRRAEFVAATEALTFGGNRIDLGTYEAQAWDASQYVLTHREATILRVLAECAGSVVARDDLLDRVWGNEVLPSTRAIDVHVARLRQRFEHSPDHPEHFHTVPGIGYRFTPDPEVARW